MHFGDLPDFHRPENFVERRECRRNLDCLESPPAHFWYERKFPADVGGVQEVCRVFDFERGGGNLPARGAAALGLRAEHLFEFRARI